MRHSIELYGEIVEKYPTDLHALKLAQMICLYTGERALNRDLTGLAVKHWKSGVPYLRYIRIIVCVQNRLLLHI